MTYQETIQIATRVQGELHDITQLVESVVQRSGVETGIAHVFNVGSTAAVGAIEYEPGLAADLPDFLNRIIPPSREYGHERAWHDGNGHSHIQATLMGPSLTVPIRNNRLFLGTWQQIFHLECDIKPRSREIAVTVLGDYT